MVVHRAETELLPVNYFHVVFTLPQALNRLCMHEPKKMYNILFPPQADGV